MRLAPVGLDVDVLAWPSTRRSTSPTERTIGLLRASGRDDPVSVRVGGGYRDLLQRVPDQPSEDGSRRI